MLQHAISPIVEAAVFSFTMVLSPLAVTGLVVLLSAEGSSRVVPRRASVGQDHPRTQASCLLPAALAGTRPTQLRAVKEVAPSRQTVQRLTNSPCSGHPVGGKEMTHGRKVKVGRFKN